MTESLSGSSIVLTVLTDAAANRWGLVPSATRGTQVYVNGIVDQQTSFVQQLAYVNGVIWQRNINNLWWGKTSPSAAWLPSLGTKVSPLPTGKTTNLSSRGTARVVASAAVYRLPAPTGRIFSDAFSLQYG